MLGEGMGQGWGEEGQGGEQGYIVSGDIVMGVNIEIEGVMVVLERKFYMVQLLVLFMWRIILDFWNIGF